MGQSNNSDYQADTADSWFNLLDISPAGEVSSNVGGIELAGSWDYGWN